MVGRTPWSAADAPVGPLAPFRMLMSLFRQRDEGAPARNRGSAAPTGQHSVSRPHLSEHWAENLGPEGRFSWRSKRGGLRDRAVGFNDTDYNPLIRLGIVAIRNMTPLVFTAGTKASQISTLASVSFHNGYSRKKQQPLAPQMPLQNTERR
jgi:hypothetical protein